MTHPTKDVLGAAIIVAIVTAACGCIGDEIPASWNRYGCSMYIDEVDCGVVHIHAYCNDLGTARGAVASANGTVTKISQPVFGRDTYRVDGVTSIDVSQLENSGWRWS